MKARNWRSGNQTREPVRNRFGVHIGQGALSTFGRFLPSMVMRCFKVRNLASLGI